MNALTLRVSSVSGAVALAVATIAGQSAKDPENPSAISSYRPVTAERLQNPDDADWLMIRRTYNGWGYSHRVVDLIERFRALDAEAA